jgi:hypothetical protein
MLKCLCVLCAQRGCSTGFAKRAFPCLAVAETHESGPYSWLEFLRLENSAKFSKEVEPGKRPFRATATLVNAF